MLRKLPVYVFDIIIATAVFIAALVYYGQFYRDNEAKFSFYQKYFFSAVDIYCLGDPNARANNAASQELNERINLAVISCDDIKKSPTVEPTYYNGWHDTHPIFSTLVGYSWRLFGLTWTALAPLAGALAALTVVSFYVIPRCFGVPWFLAVALLPAIVPFELIEHNLPSLRDFSKVPFILLSFATLGILFKSRISYRQHLAALAASTCISVIGIGFRQDCIVIVPTILAAAGLTSLAGRSAVARLSGDIGLIVLSFVAVTLAVGLLKTNQVAQLQGYPHFLVQGFGDEFWARANIRFSGLSFMALYSDTLAWAMVDANTLAKVGYFTAFDPAYTTSGFDLILKYSGLSTADMVTRVFQVLGAISHGYWTVKEPGLWALMFLALVAVGQWRLSFFLAFTILSLAAAGSMQFSPRHVLHLMMIDHALLAIIGYRLLIGVWSIADKRTTPKLRLALLSGLGTVALAVTLVVGTHLLQHHKLEKLRSDLEREPWFPSQQAYSSRYPDLAEATLRLTFDSRKCDSSHAEAELEIEGQKVAYPLQSMDSVRSIYFALLNPKIMPVTVNVAPANCVIERSWGPLGDGSIPPLQFFDPDVELRHQTLTRHLINLFSSFL